MRQLRIEQGFSQEEFAFRVGLHRTYMGDIEREGIVPGTASVSTGFSYSASNPPGATGIGWVTTSYLVSAKEPAAMRPVPFLAGKVNTTAPLFIPTIIV